jgi:hypothetical protein
LGTASSFFAFDIVAAFFRIDLIAANFSTKFDVASSALLNERASHRS